MLIYEKDNKLNLNFDHSKSIEDNPDIVIGENEISVSGNNIVSGGGSGGSGNVVVLEMEEYDSGYRVKNKTWQEIYDFLQAGTVVFLSTPLTSQDPSSEYFSNEIVQVLCAYYTNSQYLTFHYNIDINGDPDKVSFTSLFCENPSDHPFWVPN